MNARVGDGDTVTRLVAGASLQFAHFSNEQLLEGTRRLVGRSNQVLAALLAHLAEVEARGIHRLCACATLYTYCIYELRFSEDAASRRASAAKLIRRFPLLVDAVSRGELHLTGLLQLGPVLTDQNFTEVLGRAKFRTKKEIAKLVRQLAPLPAVPDRIEPLGPELPRSLRNPTWAEFVESLCPPVRELRPGKRPADWVHDEPGALRASEAENDCELARVATSPRSRSRSRSRSREGGEVSASQVTATAPARVEPPPLDEPQLYQLQFTTGQEHVDLIERAKALLNGKSLSLGELHLQAMRLLVEKLEKKKYGAAKMGRGCEAHKSLSAKSGAGAGLAVTRHSAEAEAEAVAAVTASPPIGTSDGEPPDALSDGRYIPAAIRREVFERDEGRCTFVDERGERCRETHFLEFHHLKPFARGGAHHAANLTLRCKAHNTLAAEQDFGVAHVAEKRYGLRHESRHRAGQ